MKSHARRRRITRSLVDQRGSVFVTGFVLVFVMTMLGAALFDVARLEARLRLDSQTRVQGLEIAEYAPNHIKKSVVGVGHADKMQVQAMVRRLLKVASTRMVWRGCEHRCPVGKAA